MINILKRDYLLILANKRDIFIFLLAIPIIISFGFLDEKLFLAIIISMVYIMTILVFYNSKQDDILIYSMPLKNFDVILSKYIFLLLNVLVVISYIFGVAWILIRLGFIENIKYFNIDFLKLLISYSIIECSVVIPLAFSLRPKTSSIFISLLLIALLTHGAYLFYSGDIYNSAIDWVGLINSSEFIGKVTLLMIVSIIISCYGYKIKEF